MSFELLIEIHRDDEVEAMAIAHEIAGEHAATVTVTRVERGRTFADADARTVVATVEP